MSLPGDHPLVAEWSGAYGGVPPFGRFAVDDLAPALDHAMADGLAHIDAIASEAAPPTFENTVAPLERAGRALDRAGAIYGVYTSTLNDDAVQTIERAMAPKLAAHADAIIQNAALFARIAAVYDSRDLPGLTPEQRRLTWLHFTTFAHAGARLDAPSKQRLAGLNQRLAELTTMFTQNLLAEEEAHAFVLEAEADLAGLPDSVREGAASAAEGAGHRGRWAVLNTRSSVEPFLTYSTRRDLREKVWRMFVSRGDTGGPHDNGATIVAILRARAERAKLLGHATHAHWRLEDTMAKTPERAMALMQSVWGPAVARAREEIADMQTLADAEGAGVSIAAWDYRFYAEQVRKARYDLDQNEVKPYLVLERLREAMFWVAGRLFDLHFTELTDGSVPLYHPDVRVFRVASGRGAHVGLWYFDPYTRKGKASGAWMNEYRAQSRFDGEVPVLVSNNASFVKGRPGEPVLVSWDDARTLFHEFGHALHGLSSSVTYPSLAGTAVARDYVEFPSQLLEHWLATPEVLGTFALHHETGDPVPRAIVEKIIRSQTFNQGFLTVEYLSAAIVDMKLHLAGDGVTDPSSFERETLVDLGMPSEIVMRHRTAQFAHIFAGDAYSAGYYSYLWADALATDAFEAFAEAGGPYDPGVARRLADAVFRVGNTVDPAEGYRAFRGRDAGTGALMRSRGFTSASK